MRSLNRIKLVKNCFFSGKVSDGMLKKSSVEIRERYDVEKKAILFEKIITNEYHGKKEEVKIIEDQGLKEKLIEISKINLIDLKNNYFDYEDIHRFSSWELEYDDFKIKGTYNNIIDEFVKIAEILDCHDLSIG